MAPLGGPASQPDRSNFSRFAGAWAVQTNTVGIVKEEETTRAKTLRGHLLLISTDVVVRCVSLMDQGIAVLSCATTARREANGAANIDFQAQRDA
jgi:hypothetical protein